MLSSIYKRFSNPLKNLEAKVKVINSLEPKFKDLSEADFSEHTQKLKDKLKNNSSLDDILPEAFALVRAAAHHTLNQRHYDVQLLGGIAIHEGNVAEMMTGEGKTLASTAPIYLNALSAKGVHVVTVNEYLARRDTVWMGQVYKLLGLSIACLVRDGAFIYDPEYKIKDLDEADRKRDATGSFEVVDDFLRPITRQEAYQADITYGTNHEFGFDYLRDNLAHTKESQVQRAYNFAIIDEVDSILIDESRTPLIISAPDSASSKWYKEFARLVRLLDKETDYVVDEKFKSVAINDNGIAKVERALSIDNLYSPDNLRLVHYLEESLKAKEIFHLDKQYVVKEGEIIIVDEFTGRLMPGRRFSGGLHQALEAKENVEVKEESRTYAKISIQNYFKMYPKISGMTGTASTSAEEFEQVYNLQVVKVPSHRELKRLDHPDVIYKNANAKINAIIKRIKEAHENGQPVLIGTTSITNNELISTYLSKANLKHEVLNAKNHDREGSIIAQAGRAGSITVATNMAGRGVDIVLGGNPFNETEAIKVKEAGGLFVVGTERHDARRIDDQLRGRSGRQGDPGASQFYLSLDDDLLRIFGAEKIQSVLGRFDFPEDHPIDMKMISRAVREAQKKIEGLNFDARKHLLSYDDVLNKQRHSGYKYRQDIIESTSEQVSKQLTTELIDHAKAISAPESLASLSSEDKEELNKVLIATKVIDSSEEDKVTQALKDNNLQPLLVDLITTKMAEMESGPNLKGRLLGIFDMLWMNHLEAMEALAEAVRLRAYGQRDPLVEYRKEGHGLFEQLFNNYRGWLFENIFRLSLEEASSNESPAVATPLAGGSVPNKDKVGRNDPCPCGSGKKYKKCHGQ